MSDTSQNKVGRDVTSPSVRHIADVLERKIRTSEYRSGQWLPSERSLAEEFGVSRIIIREAVKAIEGRNLVVRSARCRPLVRAGVPTASHPASPASPPTKRRSIALLVWPTPSWPGSAMIVQGIRQTLPQDKFRMVLETAMGDTWQEIEAAEARFLRSLSQDEDIEGLILWYLGGDDNISALEAVRNAGIPAVFLDRRPPVSFEADYVGVDNIHSAQQIVRHLVTQGHRHIAHVSNQDHVSTVQERYIGYQRALEAAGLSLRPELIQRDGARSQEGRRINCEEIVAHLLGLPEPPTAIFAVNDIVAFDVVEAIRKRGLRVPADISVAGFDGVERWSPGSSFLTTAAQPFERMGAQAAELLMERLGESSPPIPARHVLLEAPLTIYGSTCPPARHGRES